jgi:hypothetical protein
MIHLPLHPECWDYTCILWPNTQNIKFTILTTVLFFCWLTQTYRRIGEWCQCTTENKLVHVWFFHYVNVLKWPNNEFFFCVTVVWTRASCLLGRSSTTSATSPAWSDQNKLSHKQKTFLILDNSKEKLKPKSGIVASLEFQHLGR